MLKGKKHTREYIVTAILSFKRSKQLKCWLQDKHCSTPRITFHVQNEAETEHFDFDVILYLLAYCRQAVSLFGN